MKYSSPAQHSDRHVSPSESRECQQNTLIPKGLSMLAYEIIQELNNSVSSYVVFSLKNESKEAIYKASQELSNYNIAKLDIEWLIPDYSVAAYKMDTAVEYMTDYRMLVYKGISYSTELSSDIAEMGQKGYNLVKFLYIAKDGMYAAVFTKQHL